MTKVLFLAPKVDLSKNWPDKQIELEKLNLFHITYIFWRRRRTDCHAKGLAGGHTNSIGDCCIFGNVASIIVSHVIRERACHMLQHLGIWKKLSIQLEKKRHQPMLQSDYRFPLPFISCSFHCLYFLLFSQFLFIHRTWKEWVPRRVRISLGFWVMIKLTETFVS